MQIQCMWSILLPGPKEIGSFCSFFDQPSFLGSVIRFESIVSQWFACTSFQRRNKVENITRLQKVWKIAGLNRETKQENQETYIYIYGPASLGTPPSPHPMLMGLYSSALVPPPPLWCGWWLVVVVVVVEEVVYVCICMYLYVFVCICIWLYDMYMIVCICICMCMYVYVCVCVYEYVYYVYVCGLCILCICM